ncbi:MAG: hypothetical protein CME71_00250 [Halobacteriovorax sp.]|nr:hypothetical protein [Halobacteriovorax sp.]|tara:strand:+ start:2887 stop:4146 length:1260 start_codon:yes stop_codon:yes gene_type:complete
MELSKVSEIIKKYAAKSGSEISEEVLSYIKSNLDDDGLYEKYSSQYQELYNLYDPKKKSGDPLKQVFRDMLLSPSCYQSRYNPKSHNSFSKYIKPLASHPTRKHLFVFNIYFMKFLGSLLSNDPNKFEIETILRHTKIDSTSFPKNSYIFPILEDLPWLSLESFCKMFLELPTPQPYVPIWEMLELRAPHKKKNITNKILFNRITLPKYLEIVDSPMELLDTLGKRKLEKARESFYLNFNLLYNYRNQNRGMFSFEVTRQGSKKDEILSDGFAKNAAKVLSNKRNSSVVMPPSHKRTDSDQIENLISEVSILISIEDYEQNFYKNFANNKIDQIKTEICDEFKSMVKTYLSLSGITHEPDHLIAASESIRDYLDKIHGHHRSRAETFLKIAEDTSSEFARKVLSEVLKDKAWAKILQHL